MYIIERQISAIGGHKGDGVILVTSAQGRFFIVREDILPEAIIKTAMAKELLAKGQVVTINEAVDRVAMSRSAFYKYKDGVFPYYEAAQGKIVTFALKLDHKAGILSTVLNTIASVQGNILTINQGIPLQGFAIVTLAVETAAMMQSIEEMVNTLGEIDGVVNVELVGHSSI